MTLADKYLVGLPLVVAEDGTVTLPASFVAELGFARGTNLAALPHDADEQGGVRVSIVQVPTTVLSAESARVFTDLIENPPAPTPALVEAFQRHAEEEVAAQTVKAQGFVAAEPLGNRGPHG